MAEEQEENKIKVSLISRIKDFGNWKGWQAVFNIVTIGLAICGITLANNANKYAKESGKPLISVTNRIGFEPRSLVHTFTASDKNFNYMIPLLQVSFTNSGSRSAEGFHLISESIFPKSRKIYRTNSVDFINPISPNEPRTVSAYPVVPIGDLEDFYFKVNFYWKDKTLKINDSLKLIYHCYQRGDKGYDLFGINQKDIEYLQNETKDFEIFHTNKSIEENTVKFYLPKRFSYK